MKVFRFKPWFTTPEGATCLRPEVKQRAGIQSPGRVTLYTIAGQELAECLAGQGCPPPYSFQAEVFYPFPLHHSPQFAPVCIIAPDAPSWAEDVIQDHFNDKGEPSPQPLTREAA